MLVGATQSNRTRDAQARADPALESRQRIFIAVLTLTLVGLVIRLFRLGNPVFWTDEYATYIFATEPLARVLGPDYASETNPPLYYLLQRAWLIAGDSRFVMRALPAFFGAACIPLSFLVGRRLLGTTAALSGAALVATSELQIFCSREIRGYTLLTAATLGALAALEELLFRQGVFGQGAPASRRSELTLWLAYGIASLVALYTHSTGVLLVVLATGFVGVLWLVGLVSRAFALRWLLVHVALGVAFAPRLFATLFQVREVLPQFWVPASSLQWTYSQVLGAYSFPKWSKPAFLVLAVAGVWSLRRQPWRAAFLLTFVIGQPLSLYLVSLYRHVFVVRALVWPTPLAYLWVGAGVSALASRFGTRAAILVTAIACLIQLGPLRTSYPEERESSALSSFVGPLRAFQPPRDLLVFAPIEFAWELWYESRELGLQRSGLGVTFGDVPKQLEGWYGARHVRRDQVVSQLTAAERVWLLVEVAPLNPRPQSEQFGEMTLALEQWGVVQQVWHSGRFELRLLQARRGPSRLRN